MPTREATVEFLLRDLPDQNGARLFLERLSKEDNHAYQNLIKKPALLSDVLALAAWSPLLATTLEQNTDYLSWLSRERTETRVRTREELKESLARFSLTHSSLDPQVLLARFRRRELLRTYLHDIRRTHTLVETTEELSNLADAILDYALSLARQDLDNRFGLPRHTDERGRIATPDFCIVALGKLGSLELNYASDIDLMFLYSDEGMTSGLGERGEVSNREYFVKLSETVVRLVGKPGGEGAAYRVDLRLRPFGRDGALACSLDEATRYYQQRAQDWERQALIRARSSAGSATLFSRFKDAVTPQIFRLEVSVSSALSNVRLAKQKIDRQVERRSGFNVKLGRGGIREIEFIAQALQLAHGGRDDWLRVSHTLISLGRLADRGFISEQERTELSEAYYFLRTLEHRLQMEHGLQTHVIPEAVEARELLAGRMGFKDADSFAMALRFQTANVRRAYDRLFGKVGEAPPGAVVRQAGYRVEVLPDKDIALALTAANTFKSRISKEGEESVDQEKLAQELQQWANVALNPHRSLVNAVRVSASLDKSTEQVELTRDDLQALMQLCGASDFFSEIIAANPTLISVLNAQPSECLRRDHRAILRAAIDAHHTFSAELAALRLKWAELLTEIGALDARNELSIFDTNRLQTELAVASVNVAYLVARREMARRFGRLSAGPRLAFLGFGRLGSGGVDYGSDLDLLIIYDSMVPSPVSSLTRDEAYARLAELMLAALSNIKREGYLYRVDLRLRPHGKNGPLVQSSDGFLDYVKTDSAPWEWLAYVKLRAIGGDMELGKMIETHARHRIHENAHRLDDGVLKTETRHVRDRLEREKGSRGRRTGTDIKYGPGGMLDVYFAVRYLQLRDEVLDEGEDRSTSFSLERLLEEGSFGADEFETLTTGYSLLRSVDHNLRLVSGRSTQLPEPEHSTARDIAAKLGFASAQEFQRTLSEQMSAIRETYNKILGD